MLQRIQTIYIILFCAVLFTASFLPFASIVLEGQSSYSFYPTGWESKSSLEGFKVYPFYSGYLVAVAFGILMLVNFKKRQKQLRYGENAGRISCCPSRWGPHGISSSK